MNKQVHYTYIRPYVPYLIDPRTLQLYTKENELVREKLLQRERKKKVDKLLALSSAAWGQAARVLPPPSMHAHITALYSDTPLIFFPI
jgi:hypothetical protein